MIANATELWVRVRQLRIMEAGLRALREQLEASNPRLFHVTANSYIRRIGSLQDEIAQYLGAHPAEVSLVLPRLDQIAEFEHAAELSHV